MNIKQFEESGKVVFSKIRFDKGFDNSVIALDFMNELLILTSSNVNVGQVAFNVGYNYLEHHFDHMSDDKFREILDVVYHWSHAFKCAYDHSSSVNFSWAFDELLKEVKPLIAY